jgi:hypothetical protein
MQMMNRAIEDAADFSEMLKKLEEAVPQVPVRTKRSKLQLPDHLNGTDAKPPQRAGESEKDYRRRLLCR